MTLHIKYTVPYMTVAVFIIFSGVHFVLSCLFCALCLVILEDNSHFSGTNSTTGNLNLLIDFIHFNIILFISTYFATHKVRNLGKLTWMKA
jgi:hypothetical protein